MRRAFLVTVFDVVIRGGRVLDGIGSPFFHADAAVDSAETTGLAGKALTPLASNGPSSR